MSESNKICMELAFSKKISYSQRIKVKEFWKFFDYETPLKPYCISSDKNRLEERNSDEQISKLSKIIWRDQFKVFQQHGLDKAALAATETCTLCSFGNTDGCSELADTVKELYEELLKDMKNFEEKLNDKTKNTTLIKHQMSRTPLTRDMQSLKKEKLFKN